MEDIIKLQARKTYGAAGCYENVTPRFKIISYVSE